jgi:cytochrome c2
VAGRGAPRHLLAAGVAALLATSCRESRESAPAESSPAAVSPSVAWATSPGDPERGRALTESFECHRCHDGTDLDSVPRERHCVACHRDIHAGAFDAPADVLEEWRARIVHLNEVPSLRGVGALLDPGWIERFLVSPHDVRPHLAATMPRLALSSAQARDIAAYLADAPSAAEPPAGAEGVGPPGNAARGETLFTQKACAACHATERSRAESTAKGAHLAPDLQHTRARVRPDRLARYIQNPASVLPDAQMPFLGLTDREADDLAAYVWTLGESGSDPLVGSPAPPPPPSRLPVLERPVTFDEVSERVLRKVCWHCHAQPDYARGDGGPGMTGGFGFPARKLDLSTYEGVLSGAVYDGERRSIFRAGPDGEPVLLGVLLARQREEAGMPGVVRGMPLGLPSMTAEEIQIVETWIAQGRPR